MGPNLRIDVAQQKCANLLSLDMESLHWILFLEHACIRFNLDLSVALNPMLVVKKSIFGGSSKRWIPEIIANIFVLASCAVLLALFVRYNGQAAPEWYVSFPTIATLPSRLVEDLLLSIIPAVINQLSILKFLVPQPLKRLEVYNKAARSIEGAPGLIVLSRFSLASLAAIVAIIQPSITTTAQLAIFQHAELVPVGSRPVPICQRLSTPPADPGSAFQGVSDETIRAMWNGIMAKDPATLNLNVECAGADKCVWGNYSTIALDYQCQDITSSINRTCLGGLTTNCSFTLPSTQLTLQNHEKRYVCQTYLPAPFSNHTAGALAAWQMLGLPLSADNTTAQAVQCVIYPVVKTYTAQFLNGQFTETLLSTWYNESGPQTVRPETPEWLMTPGGSTNGTFSISGNRYAIPLQNKGIDFFTGSGDVSYVGIYYNSQDQHQRLHASLLDGTVNQTIANFVQSLSASNRLSIPYDNLYDSTVAPETQAFGQAFRYEQRIRIRWPWLIPLAVASIITTFILLATISQTRKAMPDFVFKGDILDIFNMAPADESNIAMRKATGSTDHQRARKERFVISGDERRRFHIDGSQTTARESNISTPRDRRS